MVNAGMEMEMRKRILVVDDDHELRSLIQELLEEESYKVETAIDGVDAFEHLDHQWNAYDVKLCRTFAPQNFWLKVRRKGNPRSDSVEHSAKLPSSFDMNMVVMPWEVSSICPQT
jgi:CheY-like chemotaxis protein